MEFLNALAVVSVLYFVLVFFVAFRRNLRVGFRAYNIGANTALAALIGTLWLIFGGA